MSRRLRLWIFAAACVAQLVVPALMITGAERNLEGEAFRFRTAPVDPADLFRGRYVQLAVEATSGPALGDQAWRAGERAVALLGRDAEGFATILGVQHEVPEDRPYLFVSVRDLIGGDVRFDFPVDRYYMNEALAPEAERIYAERARGNTWIEVRVRDGEAALAGLFVDGVPIEALLKEKREPTVIPPRDAP